MAVSARQPCNPNKQKGFTLLEVMLAGVLFMFFIGLASQIMEQGLHARQQRQELVSVLNELDQWTAEIRGGGFFSESLGLGLHQKQWVTSQGRTYPVQWNVQPLTEFSKGITFYMETPSPNARPYHWKTGILFAP